MNILLGRDVAREWCRYESWREFDSAAERVADIDRYMASRGLAQSSIDRLDIAEHVLRIQAELTRTAEANVREGVGDYRPDLIDEVAAFARAEELNLSARMAAMNLAHYSDFRNQTGMERDLVSFLGSTD